MADERYRKLMAEKTVAGRRLVYLVEADSTNTLAMQWGEEDLLVVAEYQTGGRGRWQRSWHSPAGKGLYFTMTLRSGAVEPGDLPRLTLAAGVALAEAIEALAGTTAAIKWPNDVQINGRKVAGILMETSLAGGQALVATGVGVNVTTTAFPEAIADKAGSLLSETGRVIDRGELLVEIIARLDRWLVTASTGGYHEVLEEWRLRDACRDKRMSWIAKGGEVVTGVACGIDEQGCLLIRDGDGAMHTVLSGDVQPAVGRK